MFYDALNFIGKLSPGKAWNYLKLSFGFLFYRLFKINRNWGNPAGLSIEPTDRCNLKCVGCFNSSENNTNQTGFLESDVFEKILKSTGKHLLFLNLYFRGESFLHPDFISFIENTNRERIYSIVSTNGHFLDTNEAKEIVESGLNRLIVSVDGTTQKVYELFRKGGKLEKVLTGIKNVTDWKKKLNRRKPVLIIQFIVTGFNEHQIKEIKKIGKVLGVDKVVIKTAQVLNFEKGNVLIPDKEIYSRYKKESDGTYTIKNKLGNFCWRLWISTVITRDGYVLPCCFDKSAEYIMGNIKEESIVNIWRRNAYNEFRKKVFSTRKEINICSNCSEGMKVYVKA